MARHFQARRGPDWQASHACVRDAVHEPDGRHQPRGVRSLLFPCTLQKHLLTFSASYFVPSLLEQNVGLTPNLSLLIGGAVQCMFIIGSIFPTIFLDRFGRRRPMMWGSFGLGLSMMMLSVMLSFSRPQFSESTQKATASASVAFLFTYMLIFG
jgi:MFS family permease